MKVVFLSNVEGTALVGDVKDVKPGFARNFLLPRGLAAPAVEPYLTQAQAGARREAKRQQELDHEATSLAGRLEGQRITMTARVGEQGKLYGSITAVHIANEVAQLIGAEDFDHKKVLLPEAIKETGLQPVRLRLTRNIEAAIEVDVQAEGAAEEDLEADAIMNAESDSEESPASGDAPDSAEPDDSEDSTDADDES